MKFKSIKTKILTITIALLLISLSIVSSIFAIMNYKSTEVTIEKILGETAETAALAVENKLSAIKNVIQELGTLNRLSSTSSTLSEKQKILNSKIKEFGFIVLNTADKNGNIMNSQNVSSQEFFQKSIKGETYITPPMLKSNGSGTDIVISAPIWKDGLYDTEIVGVIFGVLKGEYLSEITNQITVGDTGKAYIIDKTGTTIADFNQELVNSMENSIEMAKTDKTLQAMASIEQEALKGKSDFGTVSYDGTTSLLYATPINGSDGWALGLYVDKSEFLASTYITIIICSLISLAFLVLAIFVIFKFTNKLTKPIKEMEYAVNEVAKGNYDIEISSNTNDEIGNMAISLEKMIKTTKAIIEDTTRELEEISKGNFDIEPSIEYVGVFKRIEDAITGINVYLSSTIGEIKTTAEQVSSGSNQVSAGAQALSQGATEQASSIEELSATISDISDQITANAENARYANELSTETEQEVSNGNTLMQEMIAAMDEISNKSNEIGKIIKAIEDIAFQTNILALNAAVEAARAGAAGKGFAVVADEVRNLAQKSAEAVKDTTALIEGSIFAVENGRKIANITANSLTQIVEKTSIVNEKIQNITEASSIQAESIAQVTLGVEQISAVVQLNSATAEESAAASEELSSQASILDELVNKFNVKKI